MTADVDAFMAALDHPLKAEIEAVRRIILGVDVGITELIKWKAPSFHFRDDFATINLRSVKTVQIIFHTGAKVKTGAAPPNVYDPGGLLKQLAPDRSIATLPVDIQTAREALAGIVRQWIAQM